jgi:hypothetical protein
MRPASALEAELSNVKDAYSAAAFEVHGTSDRTDAKGFLAPRSATRQEEDGRCGNPKCSHGWMKAWKDRRRPMFEGKWGCGPRCFQTMVEAAVRRELGEGGAGEDAGQHRHRVPLGLVLLTQGWITHPQLQHALEVQRRAGRGQIGRWLIDECGLEEERVTRALSMQWSCPVLSMDGFEPSAMALAAPRVLVERLGLLPLRMAAERILYLAFEDRMDASAAFAMERMSGLKVESGLVDGTQLKSARERLLGSTFVDATLEQVPDAEAMTMKMAAALCELRPRASRLVRVHQFCWMRMWLERGAMRSWDGGVPTSKEDVVDRIYTIGFEH